MKKLLGLSIVIGAMLSACVAYEGPDRYHGGHYGDRGDRYDADRRHPDRDWRDRDDRRDYDRDRGEGRDWRR